VKPKPAQENWYRVAICLHEFGQRLVAPRLQILEIFRVIGAEPHHHGKVADLGPSPSLFGWKWLSLIIRTFYYFCLLMYCKLITFLNSTVDQSSTELIINRAKFYLNQIRGFDSVWGRIFGFPIEKRSRR